MEELRIAVAEQHWLVKSLIRSSIDSLSHTFRNGCQEVADRTGRDGMTDRIEWTVDSDNIWNPPDRIRTLGVTWRWMLWGWVETDYEQVKTRPKNASEWSRWSWKTKSGYLGCHKMGLQIKKTPIRNIINWNQIRYQDEVCTWQTKSDLSWATKSW